MGSDDSSGFDYGLAALCEGIEWRAMQELNLRPTAPEGALSAVQPVGADSKASHFAGLPEGRTVQPSHESQAFAKVWLQSGCTTPAGARLRAVEGGADHLLTVRQVAARLGVSTATVYRLVDRGELAHARVSNAIRFAPADVAAFLESHKAGGKQ